MPEPSELILFLAAAVVLLVTPGPAVLYIVTRAFDQGTRAGLASTCGVAVGTLAHVAAAALGLSALLASSAWAFQVVKWFGAAYLIYLGLRRWFAPEGDALAPVSREPLVRVFFQGVWVNVLNPKTALFFLAFLPQFVDPGRGSVAWQTLGLGGAFVLLGILSDGGYALLAGGAGGWLKRRLRWGWIERYVAGGVYVALGVYALAGGAGRKAAP